MIYVLQVQTNKELDVSAALIRAGIQADVPRERILIRKGGLWSKMLKLLFPGYVFVTVDYNAEVYHIIKSVSGVIRFLGAPTPLPEHEADMIRWLSNGGEIIEQSLIRTDSEGNVIGYEGFLEGNEDKIKRLNLRQKKASVEVKFGGKTHRANLGIDFPEDKT
ncbi:MAG: hypothetical protein J6K17_14620 [Oscillospiraceae bacterium]|nr:hypothetical protein [Oscillospiraceae bacterium]